MNPRTIESLTLALIPLGIVGAIVGLILLIFVVSGHQDHLSQMLRSTAKGELSGVAFTAGAFRDVGHCFSAISAYNKGSSTRIDQAVSTLS